MDAGTRWKRRRNMIKLSSYTPMATKGAPSSPESYIGFEAAGSKLSAALKLCRKDYLELTRYFGTGVRVYSGKPAELVLARGDRRISQIGKETGKVALVALTEALRKAFPDARRIYLKSEWDEDEDGNKVLHLTPTGKVDKDERMVTGRRLEVKR